MPLRRRTPVQPDLLLGVQLQGFLSCQPQPYASSSVAIGPAGGVIQVNRHRLIGLPARSIKLSSLPWKRRRTRFARCVSRPKGLAFNAAHRPLRRMDYSNCSLLSLLPKRIVYTDEHLNLLQRLLSLDLLSLLKVEAFLDHFSRYAIHY